MDTTHSLTNSYQYAALLRDILMTGIVAVPRGQVTLERLNHSTVWTMEEPVIYSKKRKLSYKFMFGEAWWIMAGKDDLESILPYNARIANYSDDGLRFFGAYGPKVVDQLDYVIETLVKDENSRQAVLNIWRENPYPTKDYPCTLNLQWLIRDNVLHCFDNMRSSDVWWGVPYDVFNMSVISLYVLGELRKTYPTLILGKLFLTAASQHIYEPFYESADAVIKEISGTGDLPDIDADVQRKWAELYDYTIELGNGFCYSHFMGRLKTLAESFLTKSES